MRYSTLLFDNDDTIMDFAAAERIAFKKTMEDNALPFSEELLASYSAINLSFWKRFERGEIKQSEIYEGRYEAYRAAHSLDFNVSEIAKQYFSNLAFGHILVPGARELLHALADRYDIYIVTNGVAFTQNKRIADSGLLPLLKGVFISETTGYQKPHPGYFDYVFSHINEKDKSKILIIGDSLSSDIKGGQNAGIDTCWFNPKGSPSPEVKPTYEIRSLDELYKIV